VLRKLFLTFVLLLGLKIHATHIVGGEIFYDYLGSNNYRITLKIYRDCTGATAPFDGSTGASGAVPAIISVIDVIGGASPILYNIGTPIITKIPPTINNPCIQTPDNICVEEGVYTCTINLAPKTGGYYVVYQRCCRNNSVLNLLDSGNQGSTYYIKIPGPEEAIDNSSPRFNNFPPIFLCSNLDFSFDHLATDPDGDQLVYSLCPPFLGLDGCCPFLGSNPPSMTSANCLTLPFNCPTAALPPPYANVNFISPYNGSYPLASNPSITINSNTGLLKGQPNLIGQFVVAFV
jgi:hypothetical protein